MLPLRSPIPNRAPKPVPVSAVAVEGGSELVFAFVPCFEIGRVRASFSFLAGDTSLLSSAELETGTAGESLNVLNC